MTSMDSEIDTLVDKLSEQLKQRLKKMVARHEKLIVKEYISSQKQQGSSNTKTITHGKNRVKQHESDSD